MDALWARLTGEHGLVDDTVTGEKYGITHHSTARGGNLYHITGNEVIVTNFLRHCNTECDLLTR